MNHLFLNYELSKKLRELTPLEFDEQCLANWNGGLRLVGEQLSMSEPIIAAPLYQQVTDWLLEKHNINIEITRYKRTWSYDISYMDKENLTSGYGWMKKQEALDEAISAAFKILEK